MSSPTDPSTVTCRYWATSGTCFFGDQCNFSHSLEEKGNVTKAGAVPKKEKACRNLLLTGYCKDENTGCEYNHDIVGITRTGPPSGAQANSIKTPTTPSSPLPSSNTPAPAPTESSPKKAGPPGASSLAQSLQARSVLPVSAPAFVPAAVAAAQRAALNAWGGITPGKGGGGEGANPNGVDSREEANGVKRSEEGAETSVGGNSDALSIGLALSMGLGAGGGANTPRGGANTVSSSAPVTPTGGNTPSGGNTPFLTPQPSPVKPRKAEAGNSSISTAGSQSMKSLPANINAAPFVPKSASLVPTSAATSTAPSRVANVNAPPFVPNTLAPPSSFYTRSKSSPVGGFQGPPNQNLGPPNQGLGHPNQGMGPPNQGSFNPGVNAGRGDGTMSPRMGGGGLVHGQGAGMGGIGSPRGMGGPGGMGPFDPQRRQMSQFHQQALHQQQHAAAAVRGRGGSLPPYSQQGLDNSHRPFPGPAAFGLPEGDDPALGMSSMSPPHPRGGPHFNSQFPDGAGPPNHRIQDAMAALKMGDGGGRFAGGNHPLNRSMSALGMMSPRDEFRSRTPPIGGMMQSAPGSPMKQQLGRATPPLGNQGMGRPRPGQMQPFGPRSNSPSLGGPVPAAATQVGGATYFFGPGQGAAPPMGHMGMGPAGGFGLGPGRPDGNRNRGVIRPGTAQMASRFLPESLREEVQQRAALVQAQIDPEQDISDLPEFVGRYHTLYPLESSEAEGASSLGVRTTVFKGISSTDGLAYAIRRIDHRQVIPTAELATAANETIDRWSHLAAHPHLGVLREAFVSKEIEDSPALYFAYDYYPGAVSLEAAHLQQEQTGGVVHLTITEDQLWSYTIQLATALRAVHGAGLICRGGALDASKVLITSRGRIRLCAVGFLDVLHGDPGEDKQFLQRIDLAEMGRLLLSLACGSAMNASLDFMAAHYSPDLVRITQALIASSPDNHEVGGLASVKQLTGVLGDRMFGELEHCHVYSDKLMDELEKESENGRLLRIVIKCSMVNERPDDDVAESNWSETGDRYLLKLFRDFVFHQTTDEGRPSMDWGHVIEALNKLDAGVSEKVTLLSRDEQSLLVASYKDLKRCLEGTYSELQSKASGVKRRPSYQANPLLLGSQAMGVTQGLGLR